MGRLIDADKLILSLNDFMLVESPNDTENTEERRISEMVCKIIQHCIEVVEEQPIAYDVEKVVEQLQQQANQYNRRALELVEKSTEAGIHNKGKACSYEHAIEIVRQGGVE